MNKEEIRVFFDQCASFWDEDMIRNEDVISSILDNAEVRENIDVLDVACGTGVLFQDYIDRNVSSITAIDLSPEMVKIAKMKYPQVNVICGDVENTKFDKQFDVVMVYNAFPHFLHPESLIKALSYLVKPGGKISIAHGMSKEALSKHHENRAKKVSIELLDEDDLAKLLSLYFDVDHIIADDVMYQVTGKKRE